MVVEGRVFKFKVNEDGVWSAPIISRLPHTVRMGVYLVDADAFADVEFKWTELWTRDLFRVVVSGEPPNVRVASVSAGNSIPFKFLSVIARPFSSSTVWAGRLELPPNLSSLKVEASVSNQIRDKVFRTVAEVMGKDVRQVSLKSPFSGSSAPTFVQKIEIIQKLEREFRFKIPDEHWNYLNTVGELVDYVQKRQLLNTKGGSIPVQRSIPTKSKDPVIPQSPVFKR
jgi:acyl carrier protein